MKSVIKDIENSIKNLESEDMKTRTDEYIGWKESRAVGLPGTLATGGMNYVRACTEQLPVDWLIAMRDNKDPQMEDGALGDEE